MICLSIAMIRLWNDSLERHCEVHAMDICTPRCGSAVQALLPPLSIASSARNRQHDAGRGLLLRVVWSSAVCAYLCGQHADLRSWRVHCARDPFCSAKATMVSLAATASCRLGTGIPDWAARRLGSTSGDGGVDSARGMDAQRVGLLHALGCLGSIAYLGASGVGVSAGRYGDRRDACSPTHQHPRRCSGAGEHLQIVAALTSRSYCALRRVVQGSLALRVYCCGGNRSISDCH